MDKVSAKLIGWCGLMWLDGTADVEIAYGLAKDYSGKGLATEAAAAAMKYGFEQLHLHQIVAIAWPKNMASRRVMEKLGMKYVKTARFSGVEMVYYVIVREEYEEQRQSNGAGAP